MGSDSVYFNKENKYDVVGAYNSQDSKYYDWFKFYDWPDGYDCWWGIKTLPSVNQENPQLHEFTANVLKEYMSMGLLGFRLDVVDEIGHNYLTKICDSIREVKENALIIGEVWEDASTKIAYGKRRGYFLGHELNSVMNYPLKDALLNFVLHGNANHFYYVYQMIQDNYPEFVKHNLMNLIDSHDTPRFLHSAGNQIAKQKLAAAFQLLSPGMPMIYYGDEFAMQGAQDPDNRRGMYWDETYQNKEMYEWYRKLIWIRKEYACICNGETCHFYTDDENGILVIERTNKQEQLILIFNCSKESREMSAYKGMKNLTAEHVFEGFLKPYEMVVLK
jgi:glycosidase